MDGADSGDAPSEQADAKLLSLSTAQASAPRCAGSSLLYLSSLGAGDGVWRFDDGPPTELWKGSDGGVLASPAPSRDGARIALVIRRDGKLRLHVLAADGGELQTLADSVDVRGGASWSPDGKWIVVGGNQGGQDGLFKVPVDGGSPVRLLTGPARNPVWSPDGSSLIVYVGSNVSAFAPLLAVRADGSRVDLPQILTRRDGERVRFMPNGRSLIYMQGTARAPEALDARSHRP